MFLLRPLLLLAACLQAVRGAGFKYPSAPLLPIAPIAEYDPAPPPTPLARASGCPTCAAQSNPAPANSIPAPPSGGSNSPCIPSPCGPNTRCEVNSNGIAQCRCLENFVPDGHTINGCKPQCLSDSDCGHGFRCLAGLNKCERVCQLNTCGLDAFCTVERSRAKCECPQGFEGNPDISCSRIRQQDPPPPPAPCQPNPCGANARCTPDGHRAICSCEGIYEGDGIAGCRRSECTEKSHCHSDQQICKARRCINPCREIGVCGHGADCKVENGFPICSCPDGYTGDAFRECKRFDPATLCQPDTCGRNADCTVRDRIQPVCTCKQNYIGDPLTGCRPECERDSECSGRNYVCQRNKCVNPCSSTSCGSGAQCSVKNGVAVCECPQYHKGSPYSRCYLECQRHSECASFQACGREFTCIDPCKDACGANALCRVEDHKPICRCPKDHKGHPFEACVPFSREDLCRPNPCGSNAVCTPGYDRAGKDRPVCTCPAGHYGNSLKACVRGECARNTDCSRRKVCHEHRCQNPCYTDKGSVCGDNAKCEVVNHIATCACERGFTGDARHGCRPLQRPRFTVGRSSMMGGVW